MRSLDFQRVQWYDVLGNKYNKEMGYEIGSKNINDCYDGNRYASGGQA